MLARRCRRRRRRRPRRRQRRRDSPCLAWMFSTARYLGPQGSSLQVSVRVGVSQRLRAHSAQYRHYQYNLSSSVYFVVWLRSFSRRIGFLSLLTVVLFQCTSLLTLRQTSSNLLSRALML